MSRVAKAPIEIPAGVEVTLNGQEVTIKGAQGSLSHVVNDAVELVQEENELRTVPRDGVANSTAQAGTARALLNNMVVGVSKGFERKLQLMGVGYRAQAQGNKLNLTLGFSHPVEFEIPAGITIETPSQTEVVVKGANKQLVGQVAANIRAYRKPEPYKGKGVRYSDEQVRRKEAKKK
ncbi:MULTISPECIES: 50S ribosomal protein L6 [Idiomarina]|jgi:large subunit ribosomal protein L6|uniref:Large ribosomal subunit protein uL6 n=1 Tax=Idiomarina baltica OS145 TaxID=314276 RepID=A0ABM9WJF4_9GAMM|nr:MULTISPECIES: 50S ribosomal protein L6 [Idiomarina]MAD54051.1 50S ribosomal protein L6 [Idiomarinaceae bacterium]MEC8924553.1 50S ribosomal protein L6 [Pseudomonadota bacterium]EAQ30993.1 50S ribosomal protein L6 [Idiomarina baltica OS145]KXS34000.1 MAG: large subunit ribosomal protein L6 [Idiomarina sp. T82-3]MAF76072.1 50S ribosomal protein L6 [Idiomarinaceae bacterium]|tara:strand:- start:2892 stop:3425 length:534 start_codon:yes stop_codon:yes gene_type:complete